MRQREWFALEERGDHIVHRLVPEWHCACDHLIEHYAQTEDVRARINLLPKRLLR
jgi:hypothetical protein